MIIYLGPAEAKLGLTAWARHLLRIDPQGLADDVRAELEAEKLQVANMMWAVADFAKRAKNVYA